MNIHKYAAYFVILIPIIFVTGCGKAFVIKEPNPSSIKYTKNITKVSKLSITDSRTGNDKKLSVGRLSAKLVGMEDEISFLGNNLEKALNSRGASIKFTSAGAGKNMELKVRKFQIRNHRSSGFSPYLTFTTFSGDLIYGNKTKRITAYFKNGKVPVWAFREVEEPCYNVPVSIAVKEIATKINKHVYGLRSSNQKVKSLVQEINGSSEKYTYLKVLELGYTNNPAAVPHLVKLTKHSDSMIRATAVSALGMLQAVDQLEFLKKFYATNKDTQKFMALKSIGDLGTRESKNFIMSVKKSKDYNNKMIREVVDLYL